MKTKDKEKPEVMLLISPEEAKITIPLSGEALEKFKELSANKLKVEIFTLNGSGDETVLMVSITPSAKHVDLRKAADEGPGTMFG